MAQRYDYEDRNRNFSDRDQDRWSKGRSDDRSQSRGNWGDDYDGGSDNGRSRNQDEFRGSRGSRGDYEDQWGSASRGYDDDSSSRGGYGESGLRTDRFGAYGDRNRGYGQRGYGQSEYGTGGFGSGGYGQPGYGQSNQDRFGSGGRMGGQGGSFGYQAGYGGENRGGQQHQDPHYHDWRDRQMRSHDDDYAAFNAERQKKFDSEFDQWRANRNQGSSDQSSSTFGSSQASRPGGMTSDKQNESSQKKS